MSRLDAPLATLRRPVSTVRTYWVMGVFASAVVLVGVVMKDPYMFAAGLASMVLTELWMIRKAIEAKAG